MMVEMEVEDIEMMVEEVVEKRQTMYGHFANED